MTSKCDDENIYVKKKERGRNNGKKKWKEEWKDLEINEISKDR